MLRLVCYGQLNIPPRLFIVHVQAHKPHLKWISKLSGEPVGERTGGWRYKILGDVAAFPKLKTKCRWVKIFQASLTEDNAARLTAANEKRIMKWQQRG